MPKVACHMCESQKTFAEGLQDVHKDPRYQRYAKSLRGEHLTKSCKVLMWLGLSLEASASHLIETLCRTHQMYLRTNEGVCPCLMEFLVDGKKPSYSKDCCQLSYLYSILKWVHKERFRDCCVDCLYSWDRCKKEDQSIFGLFGGDCRMKHASVTKEECDKKIAHIKANANYVPCSSKSERDLRIQWGQRLKEEKEQRLEERKEA